MVEWNRRSPKCPNCRQPGTFTFPSWKDVDDEDVLIALEMDRELHSQKVDEPMHSNIGLLPKDVLVKILKQDRLFLPDQFEQNYSSWPGWIRRRWTYVPVTLEIEGKEENIAYKLVGR